MKLNLTILPFTAFDLDISAVPFHHYTKGNQHFYTTDQNELDHKELHGYIHKGVQCKIYKQQVSGTKPLYRYIKGNGNYFYTLDGLTEIGTITVGEVGNYNYKSQGIAGYCFPEKRFGTIPLYRYHKDAHLYTTDPEEVPEGYQLNGIACYTVSRMYLFSIITF